jgi:hypothetical protein
MLCIEYSFLKFLVKQKQPRRKEGILITIIV